jgi:hypothetical protein
MAGSRTRVDNLTRGETVVSQGQVANNYWSRLRGLIGHKPLAEGEALLIVPCNSIHTHFMGFPIDVLYVDRALKIVGLDETMVPWRFGRLHRGACFVVELPAGRIAATGTQMGDQLRVEGAPLFRGRAAVRLGSRKG